MKPIYKPKGRAEEYSDYAVNIYTSCNHGCKYCFAEKNAKRWGKEWGNPQPKYGLVEALQNQLKSKKFNNAGKLIHLCFTCDPYPADIDTSITREVIKAIKDSGNHVQILTKGGDRALRDLDLLDKNDNFGISISCYATNFVEPKAAIPLERINAVYEAKKRGIKTWVSCEPVLLAKDIEHLISSSSIAEYVDMFKIGKLNHKTLESMGLPPIDWKTFGLEAERLCIEHGRNYMIKEDLRKEMNAI